MLIFRFCQLELVAASGVMSPIFLCLWKALCGPIQLVLGLSKFLGYIYKYLSDIVLGIWLFVSSVLKVASNAEVATVHTYEVSMWRALWNDLFSTVIKDLNCCLFIFLFIKLIQSMYS